MGTKRTFKSKRKLSVVAKSYRKWSEWETGDIIVGKYVGKKKDKYNKWNYLVEIESVFFKNKKVQKKITEAGSIGLNETGKLKSQMEQVEEGDVIQVTYNGTYEIKGGDFKGEEAHDIEVEIGSVGGDDDDESEDEDDSDDEEEDDEENDDL